MKNKQNLFAILQILTAIYAMLILTKYNIIPNVLFYLYSTIGDSFTLGLFVKFFIGIIYLIFPTIMLGASFPLASSLIIRDMEKAGSDVGKLYSWDLFGAIAGALIAGFILIPTYGLIVTFIFGGVLNIIAGLLVVRKKKLFFIIGFILIFVSFSIAINNEKVSVVEGIDPNSTGSKWFEEKDVLFVENSAYGEIRVVNDSDFGLVLYINRRAQCFEKESQSERKIADLVLDNFKNKASVLNIGLGCGFTLNQILKNNVDNVAVVEINPVVVKASDYFEETKKSLEDKRTNLIVEDGSHYLRTIDKKYDATIIDIENPAIIHSSPLFTVEYFKMINSVLEEDGVFGLWVFDGSYEYKKILYKSLRNVFNNVVLLEESGNLIFIASNKDLEYDLADEEKERIDRLEKDNDYQLNTLDHNILGDLFEKERSGFINEEDKIQN